MDRAATLRRAFWAAQPVVAIAAPAMIIALDVDHRRCNGGGHVGGDFAALFGQVDSACCFRAGCF